MTTQEFEKELKQLNEGFHIEVNPKIPALSGIYFRGVYICAIPSNYIFNEKKPDYKILLPNGMEALHKTRPEALAQVKKLLRDMKNDADNYEASMGLGKYSDEKLDIKK